MNIIRFTATEAKQLRTVLLRGLHGASREDIRDRTMLCCLQLLQAVPVVSPEWTVCEDEAISAAHSEPQHFMIHSGSSSQQKFPLMLCAILSGELHLLLQELVMLFTCSRTECLEHYAPLVSPSAAESNDRTKTSNVGNQPLQPPDKFKTADRSTPQQSPSVPNQSHCEKTANSGLYVVSDEVIRMRRLRCITMLRCCLSLLDCSRRLLVGDDDDDDDHTDDEDNQQEQYTPKDTSHNEVDRLLNRGDNRSSVSSTTPPDSDDESIDDDDNSHYNLNNESTKNEQRRSRNININTNAAAAKNVKADIPNNMSTSTSTNSSTTNPTTNPSTTNPSTNFTSTNPSTYTSTDNANTNNSGMNNSAVSTIRPVMSWGVWGNELHFDSLLKIRGRLQDAVGELLGFLEILSTSPILYKDLVNLNNNTTHDDITENNKEIPTNTNESFIPAASAAELRVVVGFILRALDSFVRDDEELISAYADKLLSVLCFSEIPETKMVLSRVSTVSDVFAICSRTRTYTNSSTCILTGDYNLNLNHTGNTNDTTISLTDLMQSLTVTKTNELSQESSIIHNNSKNNNSKNNNSNSNNSNSNTMEENNYGVVHSEKCVKKAESLIQWATTVIFESKKQWKLTPAEMEEKIKTDNSNTPPPQTTTTTNINHNNNDNHNNDSNYDNGISNSSTGSSSSNSSTTPETPESISPNTDIETNNQKISNNVTSSVPISQESFHISSQLSSTATSTNESREVTKHTTNSKDAHHLHKDINNSSSTIETHPTLSATSALESQFYSLSSPPTDVLCIALPTLMHLVGCCNAESMGSAEEAELVLRTLFTSPPPPVPSVPSSSTSTTSSSSSTAASTAAPQPRHPSLSPYPPVSVSCMDNKQQTNETINNRLTRSRNMIATPSRGLLPRLVTIVHAVLENSIQLTQKLTQSLTTKLTQDSSTSFQYSYSNHHSTPDVEIEQEINHIYGIHAAVSCGFQATSLLSFALLMHTDQLLKARKKQQKTQNQRKNNSSPMMVADLNTAYESVIGVNHEIMTQFAMIIKKGNMKLVNEIQLLANAAPPVRFTEIDVIPILSAEHKQIDKINNSTDKSTNNSDSDGVLNLHSSRNGINNDKSQSSTRLGMIYDIKATKLTAYEDVSVSTMNNNNKSNTTTTNPQSTLPHDNNTSRTILNQKSSSSSIDPQIYQQQQQQRYAQALFYLLEGLFHFEKVVGELIEILNPIVVH